LYHLANLARKRLHNHIMNAPQNPSHFPFPPFPPPSAAAAAAAFVFDPMRGSSKRHLSFLSGGGGV
jgi:hypothetical protein